MQMQMRYTLQATLNASGLVDDDALADGAMLLVVVQAKGIASRCCCCGCCSAAVGMMRGTRNGGEGEEMWRRTREWL